MNRDPIGAYVDELRSELEARGVVDRRFLREVRAHLRDASRPAERRGEPTLEAQRRAVARFGSPSDVAASFAAVAAVGSAERTRRMRRLRVAGALTALALVGSAMSVAASVALDRPVFGMIVDDPPPRSRSATGGVVHRPPAARLVKLDPRTLRALPGRRLRIGAYL